MNSHLVSNVAPTVTTDLLIVGAGMAAGQLLRRLAHHKFPGSVMLVGRETVPCYNRVLLPHYVGHQLSASDLQQTALDDTLPLALSMRLGISVQRLSIEKRCAYLSDGSAVSFKRAVFALGSKAIMPAGCDLRLPGVTALRNWRDADVLDALVEQQAPILFVGGGLLGLEAADAIAGRGCAVTVVQRNSKLLPRQVDAQAAGLLLQHLQAKGVEVILQDEVATLDPDGDALAVTFKSGQRQQRAFAGVVLATGCTPNKELAESAGISVGYGVLVDESLATSAAGIYALGECAEIDGTNYQLVEPINVQADVLAQNLCGGVAIFSGAVQGSHLKIEDVPLFFAGTVPQEIGMEDAVIEDSMSRVYRRLCIDSGVLRGAVLFGDTVGAREIQNRINTALSPSQIQDLAFGQQAA